MKSFRRKLAAVAMAALIFTLSAFTGYAENKEEKDISTRTSTAEDFDTYLNTTLPKKIEAYKTGRTSYGVKEIVREYAERSLPGYLYANGFDGTYDVSGVYKLCNFDGEDAEKYFVVVSENGKMIASLTIGFTGNDIVSAFRPENIAVVDKAIKDDLPLVFGYSNNCFLVYSGTEFTVVENPDYTDTKFVTELAVNEDDLRLYSADVFKKSFSADLYSASGVPKALTYANHYVSNIQIVPNATNPDTLGGLCWAACVACMGMQKFPSQSYSALGIYYMCKYSSYPGKPSDIYPIGKSSWIQYAFNNLGISTICTSALNSVQISNILDSGKPILSMVYPDSSFTSNGHALVFFNFIENTSTQGTYIFMDPASFNTAGTISVSVGSSVMNNGANLTLVSRDNDTYTYWNKSIY